MALSFGVASSVGSYGELQNITLTNTCEIGEARDEAGDVCDYTAYNEKMEVSGEYVFDGTAPLAGAVITAATYKIVLTEVTVTESNQDYKKMSFKGHRYLTNAKPA